MPQLCVDDLLTYKIHDCDGLSCLFVSSKEEVDRSIDEDFEEILVLLYGVEVLA